MSSTADSPDSTSRRLRHSRGLGIAAILVVGIGYSLVMQTPGWAQTSYYAMVRALGNGTAQIDAYHWETKDKSWINGHFYSVKAPGLPLFVLPAYEGLKAVGFETFSADVGQRVREQNVYQWYPKEATTQNYGYSKTRARAMQRQISNEATMIWALGLLGTVLPAILLMLIVRRLAEGYEPGTGAASALALGLGTMVLPFATQFLGHMLAALALFGAFALMHRERRGSPRIALVAVAGLCAGLAVLVEYPLAFGGAIVGLYAVLRSDTIASGFGAIAKRAAAFAGGVIVGVIPVAIYNQWAFGSPGKMSYTGAVAIQGFSGHDQIGLNDSGFFGIGIPKPSNFVELLFAPRGLIAATPIVVAGLVGTLLMYRRGHKAEARTILGVAAIYLIYAAGYWLPFGGGTPGPRFLIPMLPFLALGLPFAWKRIPSTTLALVLVGTTVMTIATITFPLVGQTGLHRWWNRLYHGEFLQTVLTAAGAGNGWLSTGPVVACFLLGILLAALATSAVRFRSDIAIAAVSLAAWLVLALKLAPLLHEHKGDELMPVEGIPWRIVVMAAMVAVGGTALAVILTWREKSSGGGDSVDQERTALLTGNS